jgi:ABC-2 type transport system permease protein
VVEALRLWRLIVGARIRAQLQYRVSFALNVVAVLAVYVLDFVVILVLFESVPALGGFSVEEVAFLYGTSQLGFAITDLAIGHLDDFPVMIREGTFDLILVRPLGTLFQVVTADFALRRAAKIVQAVAVLGYALVALDIDWTPGRAAMLAAMVASGAVIFAAVWILGAAALFWTVEGGEWLNAFTYGGSFLAQYPANVFGSWFRRLLVYLLPFGFVAYFPGLYVLGREDPLGLPRLLQFVSPLVAVAAAVVAALAWRGAVRHYRSAGG